MDRGKRSTGEKLFRLSLLSPQISRGLTRGSVSKQSSVKQIDSNMSKCEVNLQEVQMAVSKKVKELPYQCEVCDKSFRQASSLVIHLKVHAGKYTDNCVIS
jgi:uncharacterized Zn-finger protein